MDRIKCPHCGKDVELSEAIVHQLSKSQVEKARAEEKEKVEKEQRERAKQENEKKDKEIENLQKKLEQTEEQRQKNEEKIREEAQKKAVEDQALKIKEKDIKLDQINKVAEDLRRANEDLKRKLEQGSQQMQGEALEQNFEEKLKKTFPNDEFVPVPKGVEGGDVWQKVRFNGKEVGSILWEAKRTKAWANSWTTKLKDDAAKISASESIIVSSVLPNGMVNFDRKDGVWITTYEHSINIARYVRFLITSVSNAKSGASHTEEEWGAIRDYMMSDSFKHRMQAHFDSVNALRISLQADQRATTLRWKKQEDLIKKLDMNTANFYGELKAIVTNLPELTEVETNQLVSGEDDQTLF